MAYVASGEDQVQSGRNANEVRRKDLGMVAVELQDPVAAFAVRGKEGGVEESSCERTAVSKYGS